MYLLKFGYMTKRNGTGHYTERTVEQYETIEKARENAEKLLSVVSAYENPSCYFIQNADTFKTIYRKEV